MKHFLKICKYESASHFLVTRDSCPPCRRVIWVELARGFIAILGDPGTV